MGDSGFELPREVALAWGIDGGPRRGRRPRLDLDGITAAAITLADAEGLAAVSMNRVAAHLGVSPMSLYRYVESKDELVQLMADAALGRPDIPDPLTGDWRTDLAAWATGASACYRRHPWVTEVPISRLPVLPCNLAWTDYALRVLANTPLTFQDRLSVIALLSGHARNEAATSVQLAQGRTGSGEEGGDAGDAYARTLDAVVGAERFPALRAVVDEHLLVPAPPGEGDAATTEEVFLFGLERILDGIAVLVERRRRDAG
ncbi:TetR/AcrR family transcriptional regulator [Nocardiopsis tropica]|jgi:AcrR family transcriptional regulator|uniref:TetR/AcrR family transcriptional regulator n=1 Tax=Nocardiopsis tropica TaxID=109330 RepID=A0ABU7KSD7_9ACTN|nr:TetR/AcrR family transcriptional regulator [Nocardiopsis umidischolae]MEE2052203.1 TetR/AcrR family transcriptional regulator [Nocardiopsis umidischolae]